MIRHLLPVLLGLLLVSPVRAQDPQQTLRRFADTVQTLSADFVQVQTDERGRTTSRSEGRMWLSRPGRFRWDYQKPYAQQLVCDGQRIWLYDPDLAQVTVRSAQETLGGTPAALLSQRSLLSDAFTLQDGGKDGDAHIVRLLPRAEDGDFKSIELSLQAGVPRRIRFFDQLGGTTEVRFDAIRVNPSLKDDLFRFTPPPGTEVVDGQ